MLNPPDFQCIPFVGSTSTPATDCILPVTCNVDDIVWLPVIFKDPVNSTSCTNGLIYDAVWALENDPLQYDAVAAKEADTA